MEATKLKLASIEDKRGDLVRLKHPLRGVDVKPDEGPAPH
jgi:hypothetical protein